MPLEQSGPTCTVWSTAGKWSSTPALAVYRNGLHYRFTRIRRIWYDTRSHRSRDPNEPLYIMQKGLGLMAIHNALHATCCVTAWNPKIYHYRQRKLVHLRTMETNYGKIRNWKKTEYSILPVKRRSNRENQCNTGTISVGIHQLSAGQLERPPTVSWARIQ